MDASNGEFLAERETVKVVPNFSHGKLYLISGDVGPFVAGLPCEVPLWLAINLRQRGQFRLFFFSLVLHQDIFQFNSDFFF